MNSEMTNSNEL